MLNGDDCENELCASRISGVEAITCPSLVVSCTSGAINLLFGTHWLCERAKVVQQVLPSAKEDALVTHSSLD